MEELHNGFATPKTIRVDTASSGLTSFDNGDIIMAKVTPCFENGEIAIVNDLEKGTGLGSSELFVFRMSSPLREYFFYVCQSKQLMDLWCSTMTGTGGLKRISPSFTKNTWIPVPPLSEQEDIAAFLDTKCAEVDDLLKVQEKFIQELKAYKQALITETVTKGLTPNTPMKHSGIDWIGNIPERWKVERLKQRILFINGYAFNSDEFSKDEGIRVIRIGDIGASIDYNGCVRSTENCANLAQYRIQENDILIAMSGATTGKTCIANNVPEAYINQRVGIIRTPYYRYIQYVLQAAYIPEYISLNNAGSAQPNISSNGIGNIPLPVPPLSEQEDIAAFLDTKCAEIDQLIALKQQKIDELQDYRKSLIYEYVTGKSPIPHPLS